MKFKGDIIITDPCYLMKKDNEDDWEECDYGDDMKVLGFTKYLVDNTIYGDWSCTTYNTDTDRVIGQFCADAGLVGVFLLKEVLKYNPKFDYHKERKWTTTLIEKFNGDVEIEVENGEDVHVVGTGNINFKTFQTGL